MSSNAATVTTSRLNHDDVRKGIFEILSDYFGDPIEDMDDSLSLIEDLDCEEDDETELVDAINARFGIEIHEDDIVECDTVGDLIDLIVEIL